MIRLELQQIRYITNQVYSQTGIRPIFTQIDDQDCFQLRMATVNLPKPDYTPFLERPIPNYWDMVMDTTTYSRLVNVGDKNEQQIILELVLEYQDILRISRGDTDDRFAGHSLTP